MAEIRWGSAEDRTAETGVDRGVLYIEGLDSGVPWSGLVNVTRSEPEAQLEPVYYDGVIRNYMAYQSPLRYNISALSSPPDFQRCFGLLPLANGFYAANQPHASFGFTYRTKIANDPGGIDYAYKIHLIFQAYAVERPNIYQSVTSTVNVTNRSYEVQTIPVMYEDSKPISYISVSTLDYDAQVISDLEDLLYGTEVSDPTLPTVSEVLSLLE